ncbi:hypothetical protein FQA39_LY18752 [Lamprigera yunnana]|nr:hypothetical protein FQA39_LY18752 [Lamprigera yunnana]
MGIRTPLRLMTPESVENHNTKGFGRRHRWSIYNENGSLLQIHPTYNVVVGGGDVQTFRPHGNDRKHSSYFGADCHIRPSFANGKPDAIRFTHNWGQTGGTHVNLDKAPHGKNISMTLEHSTARLATSNRPCSTFMYMIERCQSDDLNTKMNLNYPILGEAKEGIILLSNIRLATKREDARSKNLKTEIFHQRDLFNSGSSKLKPESQFIPSEIADILKENPDLKLKIIGHTDADGDQNCQSEIIKSRVRNPSKMN